jgi:Asp-tRNA(Asn)/Glu-tRNA(Gln) amidotransferase B subunit
MFTLNIENEKGEVQEVQVSREFLELCFKNATTIANKATSVEEICEMVEEVTSDESTRSIIVDMILHKIAARLAVQDIIQALLGE